ncbi:MAG: DUF4921 family protein [Methanosarcinaceae archaeon]|nr:DUF4921 family protein [Methanosarcinaceae archaeon]MDD4497372.1 DUF4921 family protein [Methanosarcinaceae archaeon]
MSEIRKHYFLADYCIIAEGRAKRPSDFVFEQPEMGPRASSPGSESKLTSEPVASSPLSLSCVFCAGNEGRTPPASVVYKDGTLFEEGAERVQDWDVRCFPNIYPALSPAPPPTHSPAFPPIPAFSGLQGFRCEAVPGFGFHEVIVESPVHGRNLEVFSDGELRLLMRVYRDRVAHYRQHEKIRYVSLFKNFGKAAGASLEHSHSQLLALPLLPPLFEKELQAIRALDRCPYCAVLETEIRAERLILENRDCIAFAPYCSKVPFEVWILPKKHVCSLETCSEDLLFSLGDMLRAIVSKYREKLMGPAYNCMFHLSESPEYHLSLRLIPRLSLPAGFELNTGIYINTVSPERAASCLREI